MNSIMKKAVNIGNITKVRWHYVNMKYDCMAWGYIRKSFDKDFYITKQHPYLETAKIIEHNDTMETDKYYVYICINDNKLSVRNLFDSNHKDKFEQKNAYFTPLDI